MSRDYAKHVARGPGHLHSRMSEWAALSNQQRAQARLNFADVKRLPADERKAKWEAYQALSEEEKRELAASAHGATPGAAPPIRPVPARSSRRCPRPGSTASTRRASSWRRRPRRRRRSARSPPAPSSAPPVAAEAQVPPPTPSARRRGAAGSGSIPPVRMTEQPSSAP